MKLFGRDIEIKYNKSFSGDDGGYVVFSLKIADQEFTSMNYIRDLKIDQKLPLENQFSEYIKNSALIHLESQIKECAAGSYVNILKDKLVWVLKREEAAKWLIDSFNNKR